MRKTLRWLLSLVVLIGATGLGTASAGAAGGQADIKDRLLKIKGMSLIEEKPVEGYRFFVLDYEQPVDHRKPKKGTFKQRITVLHKSEKRPTVFFTSGYGLNTNPARSEPTRIIDGNQVSMEYRFFTPSRPQPADWTKLDIWQAASDQHRIYRALSPVYTRNWISTGGSKGGMTATYYRRFYPHDMAGTVAYVAPNNVDNNEDSAYDRFLANVGTPECRAALAGVERESLKRRDEMVARYEKEAADKGWTFDLVGSADRAFEVAVLDLSWAFWQYQRVSDCPTVPGRDATTEELYQFIERVSGFSFYSDQGMTPYVPYFYQAGTQLGQPSVKTPHVDDLLRYPGINEPRTFVPREIPMRFERNAMRDIDRWVRNHSSRMLFVNGENDPWRAEPFRLGKGSRDSALYVAPGANHGANINALREADRVAATESVLRWAGVRAEKTPSAQQRSAAELARPLVSFDRELDRPMVERLGGRLP
ncbi:aminopeptidase [Streptomyces durbertensis]|uniref:Aminopeptidase n=1 Tax=Streptomyces durbertensis TaxID=2448886 RepID=A0ABR6EH91_9ACTN|nr:S28 family serine protease [Streptomyces durbertensis]MBB1244457.1 aminopeptidase [Streptomyces durbertensis]